MRYCVAETMDEKYCVMILGGEIRGMRYYAEDPDGTAHVVSSPHQAKVFDSIVDARSVAKSIFGSVTYHSVVTGLRL